MAAGASQSTDVSAAAIAVANSAQTATDAIKRIPLLPGRALMVENIVHRSHLGYIAIVDSGSKFISAPPGRETPGQTLGNDRNGVFSLIRRFAALVYYLARP